MRFLVVGATGTVGRALVPVLVAAGHEVTVASRGPVQAWPGVATLRWDAVTPLRAEPHDAVVNLAGAGVMQRRWTAKRRRELVESRVGTTRRMVAWIRDQPRRPTLLNASAVGYYGERPAGECPEDRAPGDDFLARLCQDWEAEVKRTPGRCVVLRLGHVLAPQGGYLGELRKAARWGVARLGDGSQPAPWVHAQDVARAVLALAAEEADGPYNVVSPGIVPQRRLARAAVDALAGPKWPLIGVPEAAVRLRFGSAASAILGGQAAVPARLTRMGFQFQFQDIDAALRDLVRVE